MEIDQPLQLIFNVIAITGISSLAAICYSLKRETEELKSRLNPPYTPMNLTPPPPGSKPEWSATVQMEPEPAPAQTVFPAPQSDIRQFVNQRAATWVAPSPVQWKKHESKKPESMPQDRNSMN